MKLDISVRMHLYDLLPKPDKLIISSDQRINHGKTAVCPPVCFSTSLTDKGIHKGKHGDLADLRSHLRRGQECIIQTEAARREASPVVGVDKNGTIGPADQVPVSDPQTGHSAHRAQHYGWLPRIQSVETKGEGKHLLVTIEASSSFYDQEYSIDI